MSFESHCINNADLSVVGCGAAVAGAVVLHLVEPGGDLVTPVGLGVVRTGRCASRPGTSHVLPDRETTFNLNGTSASLN